MTYLAGFVAAVPTERKQDYLHHAQQAATVLKEAGVERLVENWATTSPMASSPIFAAQCRRNLMKPSCSAGSNLPIAQRATPPPRR